MCPLLKKITVSALLLAFVHGAASSQSSDPRPPNILLVIADDLNNEFIEVYGEGPVERQPPTPTINALAAEGLRFTNAYSNPVCSATRSTIETGLYSHRTGIGWALKHDEEDHLEESFVTLPEALAPRYSSYLVGKWHLGHEWGRLDAIVHGYSLLAGRVGPFNYFEFTRLLAIPWKYSTEPNEQYMTTETTNNALQILQNVPEPWYLQVAYTAPHKPYHVPPADLHSYDDPTTKVEMYGAMVEALDTEMARLLAGVDRADTVIVFVGDNGSPCGVVHKKGNGKSKLAEGGINVPLIVAGCAVPAVHRGRTTEALVNTTDLHATVLELAGARTRVGIDGRSFVPVLEEPDHSVRDWVYSERWTPDGDYNRRAARNHRFKLLRDVRTGEEWIYDLSDAPAGEDGDPLQPPYGPAADQAILRLGAILDRPDA